jgi:hypothetical protein
MSHAVAFGPFGHTLQSAARQSGERADIQRWNEYAFALGRKLDAEAKARKAGVSGSAWFYSQSFAVRGAR